MLFELLFLRIASHNRYPPPFLLQETHIYPQSGATITMVSGPCSSGAILQSSNIILKSSGAPLKVLRILKSPGRRFDVTSVCFWCHLGVNFGSLSDHVGIGANSYGNHVEIIWMSPGGRLWIIWALSGNHFVVIWESFEQHVGSLCALPTYLPLRCTFI